MPILLNSSLPFDPSLAPAILRRVETELQRRRERAGLEESLTDFIKSGWRYIDPAPFVDNWHLEAIAEHLQAVTDGQIRRLLINVPPRTSKSSLVSVAWPAWTWAQSEAGPLSGPQVQFLFASYAQSLSLRDSVKGRRLIESPWYQERWAKRFNLTGDQNTKGRYENDRGGYRLATSVGGALTGEGGAIICVDDPHNALEVESEAIRESTLQWWDESLSTRLNDPVTGAYVIIMQRLYEDDLSGHILSRNEGDWVHLCLPMRYEPRRHCSTVIGFEDPRTTDGELLWPARFPEAEVVSLERRLGTFAASGQLQQAPAPRGGGIFKRDWWNVYPPEGETFNPQTGKPIAPLSYPAMDYIVASVDTAYTTKEENDWSACTVWGAWRNEHDLPKVMLMDAWQVRLEFRALVERIMRTCTDLKVDRLLIEAKANGISVAQEIGRLMTGKDFSLSLVDPKGDKVARAYAVTSMFEGGLIYAPDRKWADMVIDQMASFPKAAHDDLVDSSVAALKHMREIGVALLRDEREDDLRRRHGVKSARPAALPYSV